MKKYYLGGKVFDSIRQDINGDKATSKLSSNKIDYKIAYLEIFDNNFETQYYIIRQKLVQNCNLSELTSLESFAIYLETTILFLIGIPCKYYIDEIGYLNMDFYGNEETFIYLCEREQYTLQTRILADSILVNTKTRKIIHEDDEDFDKVVNDIRKTNVKDYNINHETTNSLDEKIDVSYDASNDVKELLLPNTAREDRENLDNLNAKFGFQMYLEEKQIKTEFLRRKYSDNKFIKMNKVKFEDLDRDEIYNYPPHIQFYSSNCHIYRRYGTSENNIDSYHVCDKCFEKNLYKDPTKVTCSTNFRTIDKLRLIYFSLNDLLNLEKMHGVEKTEIFEDIFENIIVMNNFDVYKEKFRYSELAKAYLDPFTTDKVQLKLNMEIKNFYGEEVGLYFTWITHYLKWLKIPMILGIVLFFIGLLNSYVLFTPEVTISINRVLSYMFCFFLLTWAFLLNRAIKCNEQFFLYSCGMDNYNFEKSNNFQSKCEKTVVFLGMKIPKFSYWSVYYKRLISHFIMLLCLIVTIALNLLLFYIDDSIVAIKTDLLAMNSTLMTIMVNSMEYIIPLLFYLLRTLLSSWRGRIVKKLTHWEDHTSVEYYHRAIAGKNIVFEFFNYYFNLYYIAFFKQYYDLCENGSCFQELGNQLFWLIFWNIVADLIKIFWLIVIKFKRQSQFVARHFHEMKKQGHLSNGSHKLNFYTKKEYKDDNVFNEYFDILLIFGYVVQFGASSPLCFLFAFVHSYFARICSSIKLIKLEYVRIIDGCDGLGLVYEFINIMTMIGLTTNVLVIFFTDGSHFQIDIIQKFFLVIILQNLIHFSTYFLNFDTNPVWFKYKDKIDVHYIEKFVKTKKVKKK